MVHPAAADLSRTEGPTDGPTERRTDGLTTSYEFDSDCVLPPYHLLLHLVFQQPTVCSEIHFITSFFLVLEEILDYK